MRLAGAPWPLPEHGGSACRRVPFVRPRSSAAGQRCAAGGVVGDPTSAPVRGGLSDRVPAWTLAVVAMLSVQAGSAMSTHLFTTVGPAGTAWLRLTAGAIVFLAISRPRLRDLTRSDAGSVLALGVATGLVTVTFLSAIERIPLGTAVAIEFLGPLGVAVFHRPDARRLIWPALALAGVVLLTEPWVGEIDQPELGDRRRRDRPRDPDAGPTHVARAPRAAAPHDQRLRDPDGARTCARVAHGPPPAVADTRHGAGDRDRPGRGGRRRSGTRRASTRSCAGLPPAPDRMIDRDT